MRVRGKAGLPCVFGVDSARTPSRHTSAGVVGERWTVQDSRPLLNGHSKVSFHVARWHYIIACSSDHSLRVYDESDRLLYPVCLSGTHAAMWGTTDDAEF